MKTDMINMPKIFFLSLALAVVLQAKAGTFEQTFVETPLKHPIAFCVPMLCNAPTYAALYILKNYQSTISPLWAYASFPLIATGSFFLQNNTDKDGKKLTLVEIATAGVGAGILATAFLTSLGLLTIKCCS